MMSFYLFRVVAHAFTIEAEYRCTDDLAAMQAAQDLVADVDAVEIWDGERFVATVIRAANADTRIPPVAA